jgi:putative transposase
MNNDKPTTPTGQEACRFLVLGLLFAAVVADSTHIRLDEPGKETATMSDGEPTTRRPTRWETFRFSVVGPLLAAPPEQGELQEAIKALASKTWRHPVTGDPARFGFSTIERWYYLAKGERVDPVGALRRKVRSDRGQQPAMPDKLRAELRAQYRAHPTWSYQLHADNLEVVATDELKLEQAPSYPTVRRFMKANGLLRRRRRGPKNNPGAQRAEERFAKREVRSYESKYVHALYHCDFHEGSRKVLTADGRWVKPQLLGVLDDRSRLCCHLQWYLAPTAENFVHGLSQAFQKRALPRALMSDNGSAMTAAETTEGLGRLGVVHDTTLPYSPEQNGKQEAFWDQIEGRLLPMLEGCQELTLSLLNEATCAWMELEYNRNRHSEIGESPLCRYLAGPEVGRPCPGTEVLRQKFCAEKGRTQRKSDGTISLLGVRFEIPNRYRHVEHVRVRYARWDLSRVWLVDAPTDTVLCPIYPLDKEKNAEGCRRDLEPLLPELPDDANAVEPGIAPLLKKLMADYAQTGLPPAYLPKEARSTKEEHDTNEDHDDKEDHHG